MEQLKKLQQKYQKQKDQTYQSYLNATPEQKEEIVKLLIATVFEHQQLKEYTELCDKMFSEPKY